MNDKLRAAILATIQSAFPVLQIAGVVSFSGDQVATIMLLISNVLTTAAFFYKSGQEPSS